MKLESRATRKLIESVLEFQGVDCNELSVYFVTERRICDLHREYFNDPTPTDCISFPIDSETLGDVFVCPKTALKYTAANGGDPYEEIVLYVIHGLLHLMGYDDIESEERRVMRKNEKKCMAHCKTLINSLRPS